MSKSPKDGAPGTTEQSPRWERPEDNRPRGYLPAIDDPNTARDAAGENLSDPEKSDLSDAFKTGKTDQGRQDRIRARAYEIWEREGRQDGMSEYYCHQAVTEIDQESSTGSDLDPADDRVATEPSHRR
jgi:hypothetical protein